MNRNSEGFDVDEVQALLERRAQVAVWVAMTLILFFGAVAFITRWVTFGGARDIIGAILLLFVVCILAGVMWGKRR